MSSAATFLLVAFLAATVTVATSSLLNWWEDR